MPAAATAPNADRSLRFPNLFRRVPHLGTPLAREPSFAIEISRFAARCMSVRLIGVDGRPRRAEGPGPTDSLRHDVPRPDPRLP
ncbi:hypothetical protein X961_5178 [Burkholderia pseudomallei MSHR5613]|nr:hypothetical protein CNX72_19935 [Burkholderia pseudomallei]KGS42838.1 hypothetical protein X961_5178 [Burkholderia pseudomallei MSHR5613]KGS71096.1 hypothetical protein X979_5895 [Burkholderia pseudomallei MSHR7527]MBM5625614.1 hypothetical protein [Burkholderia pseudomallei]MVZ88540.1 hypothetical protein [Burkholderia pseudomallei]